MGIVLSSFGGNKPSKGSNKAANRKLEVRNLFGSWQREYLRDLCE
jgi:hypothetical protein